MHKKWMPIITSIWIYNGKVTKQISLFSASFNFKCRSRPAERALLEEKNLKCTKQVQGAVVLLVFLFVSSKLNQAKHWCHKTVLPYDSAVWCFRGPGLLRSPAHCIHRTFTLWELSLSVPCSTANLSSFIEVFWLNILSKGRITDPRFLTPETHMCGVNLRRPEAREPKSPELTPCFFQERLLDQLYSGNTNIYTHN